MIKFWRFFLKLPSFGDFILAMIRELEFDHFLLIEGFFCGCILGRDFLNFGWILWELIRFGEF